MSASFEQLETRRMLNAPITDTYQPYDGGPAFDVNEPAGYQVGNRWFSTANGTFSGTGKGVTLTWSVVPDGTVLPIAFSDQGGTSNLQARLNTLYGNSATWMPIIQQTFDAWSNISGITFIHELNDDSADYLSPNSNGVLGVRGDIRIGGHKINGTSGTLAYNYFPDISDMVIDTDDLLSGGYMFDTANNSRKLRNVLAHELGHGLGFNHVDPINQTKLMEASAPQYPTYDGPQYDDMVAVNRNYGDIYEKGAANNTFVNAVNRGTLNNGTDSLTNLSLSSNNVSTNIDLDFYKFTISTSKEVAVTLSPFGPTYLQGPQNGSTSLFNGAAQMDLQVQLLASNGTTVLWTSNGTGVGSAESFDFGTLAASTYYVKVLPAPGAADMAQMYNLSMTIGDPVANTTTVALDGSNNLTVTDSGGGKNDALTITADAVNSRFVIKDTASFIGTAIGAATGSNMHTVYVPFSAVGGAGVLVDTLGGTDTINICSGVKSVTVDAGAGTDTINVLETSASVAVIINASAGSDTVNINTDAAGTALVSFPVSQTIGALTIGSGGVATLAGTSPNPPAELLVASSVSITGTGKLNLVNNDLAIDYSAASPIGGWSGTVYSGITNLLVSGRNGGTWTGNGIVTSMTAASASNPITTLGVAESSLALNISGAQTTVFDGQTIDATAVLVKYTYGGDANLNGSITGDDYFLIDAGYSAQATGWSSGDFDYNGRVDADDYFRIDSDYNKGSTPLYAPLPLASASTSFVYLPPPAAGFSPTGEDSSAFERLIEQAGYSS